MTSNYRGKDFRPAFANIGGLRALTDVPFMALTASASADTESAIVKSLQLKQPAVVTRQLDRANIYLSARIMQGVKVSFVIGNSGIRCINLTWLIFIS